MPKCSTSKKGMVEVEAWGTNPALIDWVRRTWGRMWAEGTAQSGDLVNVLAQAEAVAFALTQAVARAVEDEEAVALMRALALEARAKVQAEPQAETEAIAQTIAQELAEADAQVQVQVKAKAQASAWVRELVRVHHAMRAWMQALGQMQAQTWLRLGALEACKMKVEHDLWPRHRQDYWWLIQIITPIARLPPELLQQIFHILIDNDNDSPLVLMLVSNYWYNIVTHIWASLKLGTTTPKDAVTRKLERNQCLLSVVVNTDIDRYHRGGAPINFNIRDAYQGIFAAMQATSRWRSLEIVAFPTQADLPERLVNRGLQQCSDPTLSHLRTLIIKYPCEMSPLLARLLRSLSNTASRELTTVTIKSPHVISFLVPTYSPIFRFVTVLSLDAAGLRNPVDFLPHLHQLEDFTASHLPLPVYQNDADLPFVHTLRHLTLICVSIQWMNGRTFNVLESCKLLLPLHSNCLHTFRTTLPTCKHLSFTDYTLSILNGISAHKVTHLSVIRHHYCKQRGSSELQWYITCRAA